MLFPCFHFFPVILFLAAAVNVLDKVAQTIVGALAEWTTVLDLVVCKLLAHRHVKLRDMYG